MASNYRYIDPDLFKPKDFYRDGELLVINTDEGGQCLLKIEKVLSIRSNCVLLVQKLESTQVDALPARFVLKAFDRRAQLRSTMAPAWSTVTEHFYLHKIESEKRLQEKFHRWVKKLQENPDWTKQTQDMEEILHEVWCQARCYFEYLQECKVHQLFARSSDKPIPNMLGRVTIASTAETFNSEVNETVDNKAPYLNIPGVAMEYISGFSFHKLTREVPKADCKQVANEVQYAVDSFHALNLANVFKWWSANAGRIIVSRPTAERGYRVFITGLSSLRFADQYPHYTDFDREVERSSRSNIFRLAGMHLDEDQDRWVWDSRYRNLTTDYRAMLDKSNFSDPSESQHASTANPSESQHVSTEENAEEESDDDVRSRADTEIEDEYFGSASELD